MSDSPVVELRQISKSYETPTIVRALRPADLTIRRGEYVSIVGPSGSGKSTLLHILGLLDAPTTGQYLIDGIDTAAMSEAELAGIRSARIGFVFQAFHLLGHLSTIENVMLSETYRRRSATERRRRAIEALELVGLGHRLDSFPTTLSGGERQRVAMARAMIGEPSILLADEPTGNLDSKTSARILDLFDHLHEGGLTLVVITHDPDVAARSQRKLQINDGVLEDLNNSSVTQVPEAMTLLPPAPDDSVLSARDVIVQAVNALTAKPARTMLTALGTVLGVAALVSTIGIAKTAANQIVSHFDELEATSVVVQPSQQATVTESDSAFSPLLPFEAQERLERLNGVVAAGSKSDVDVDGVLAHSVPIVDPSGQTAFQIPVIAASPGLFDAVRTDLLVGRTFDSGHNRRGDNVAVLGPGAARLLNISQVDTSPAIFLGDTTLVVIGIIEDVGLSQDLLGAIIVTDGFANEQFDLTSPQAVHIQVELGAAQLIGEQAVLALSPNDPALLRSIIPPSPEDLRASVETDLNSLFLVLGGVSLVVGTVGITNVTLSAVLERRSEIGLRRALGATRRHIAIHFLVESTILGVLAGVVGTSLGVLGVIFLSANRDWSPVLDPWLPLASPLLGGLVGLVAGTYPAWKASATEPIAALR